MSFDVEHKNKLYGKILTLVGGIGSIFISIFLIFFYPELAIFGIGFVIIIQIFIIIGGIISIIGALFIEKNLKFAKKIILLGLIIAGINLVILWGYIFFLSKIGKIFDEKIKIPNNGTILEISKVYHYYGKAKALEELNLKVEAGTLTSVIGPNGAGKSTLLRVISGLEELDRGKVIFMEHRIDELKPHKIALMGIAHCPERRRLFYDMTVLENLKLGATRLKSVSEKEGLLNFVYEIFPRLKERRKQRAGTLSGGEQQMLAIGRAIMAKPLLLLLDEPSLGLAPKIKHEIFDAIRKIKEMGTTTLLVEQDAVLAINYSDYIHVLEEGKIEMRGTKEELEKEPRIKKAYLGI